jgi:hypothetical protein
MCVRAIVVVVSMFTLAGCDRGDSPAPAPPSTPAPPPTSAPSPEEPAAERTFPEDRVVDPQRDPLVHAKAKELNALPVSAMKDLKPGDEVVVIVRADRGGGTIYGSGPYTIDSQIRKAVIHHGALTHGELGLVRVKVVQFDGEHASVPQNGITPTKYGKYHTSYTIEKIDVP